MVWMPHFALPLREQAVDPSPFEQFERWFRDAVQAQVRVPEAAALATATTDGIPSVRIVLVRRCAESGFSFYSNYESRKGVELAANPRAALVFHWDSLGRQVRLEGSVVRTSADETAAYVRSRPRASQLSALASAQSRVLDSRELLERRVSELAARYGAGPLPLPENWGGYRLIPHAFEFWQHREDRLHDRLTYSLRPDRSWLLERLAP
jgi:pyridoxamine 5'-phosphate oxidase